jgi:hypothetical protein
VFYLHATSHETRHALGSGRTSSLGARPTEVASVQQFAAVGGPARYSRAPRIRVPISLRISVYRPAILSADRMLVLSGHGGAVKPI